MQAKFCPSLLAPPFYTSEATDDQTLNQYYLDLSIIMSACKEQKAISMS